MGRQLLRRSRRVRRSAFMNSEEFVRALKLVCSDKSGFQAIALYQNPPGRSPSQRLKRLSTWFLQLTPTDRAMLIEALDDVAEGVIFGVLCVLDGVRAIETGPDKGDLELYYVKGGSRVLLNDMNQSQLHDVFQGMRSFD